MFFIVFPCVSESLRDFRVCVSFVFGGVSEGFLKTGKPALKTDKSALKTAKSALKTVKTAQRRGPELFYLFPNLI